MNDIEVFVPFVFGGKNFFRICSSEIELQRILDEIKAIQDGCNLH